ncbi:hypothetical protein I317_01880 [Kwoniella heveanensis CBS 569]|nr:hypothetical protein I317_01880 [Kwoniella heveanensis CBS 569]
MAFHDPQPNWRGRLPIYGVGNAALWDAKDGMRCDRWSHRSRQGESERKLSDLLRQYDISITPASQSHHHAHSPRYGYGPGSHSSFTPHDPYLHRAAQGPHRAWSASSASHRERASQGHAPRTEHYSPFGRRTPPNFQYTYEYNFQYNPNARRATGAGSAGRRKTGNEDEDEEHGAAGTGGGGMWKFVVTVGLILVVISLGGGLTANSQNQVDWEDIIEEQRGQGVAWEGDESDRSPQHGDVDTAPEVPSVPGRIGSGIPSQRRIETRRRTERSNESMQLQETDLS